MTLVKGLGDLVRPEVRQGVSHTPLKLKEVAVEAKGQTYSSLFPSTFHSPAVKRGRPEGSLQLSAASWNADLIFLPTLFTHLLRLIF